MPRPSSSVTIRANPLRLSRCVLIIVGFSICEMVDASPSKYRTDLALRTGLVGYLTLAESEASELAISGTTPESTNCDVLGIQRPRFLTSPAIAGTYLFLTQQWRAVAGP